MSEALHLLVVAAVVDEHHEATVGIDLARQARAGGVTAHLVVHPYNEEQARRSGFGYTLISPQDTPDPGAVLRRLVDEQRPDAVVLSDYVGHWLSMRFSYEADPWTVLDTGVPVLPIDLLELEAGSLRLEIMGRTTEVDDEVLRMPARLRPVPAARPDATPGGPGFCYRAGYADGAGASKAVRTEVRAELGLRDDDRLLVLPGLAPQHAMLQRGRPATRELARRVPELVATHLGGVPNTTHVLVAGPVFEAYRKLPPDRTHLRPDHTAAEHERWLRGADGVWSTYFPAPAIELATLCDVPGLLTLHDGAPAHRASATGSAWLAGFDEPPGAFALWPWGWNEITRPLLTGNPMLDACDVADLLDDDVPERLTALLYDAEHQARLTSRRAAYRQRIADLPPTADVVQAAVAHAREHGAGRQL